MLVKPAHFITIIVCLVLVVGAILFTRSYGQVDTHEIVPTKPTVQILAGKSRAKYLQDPKLIKRLDALKYKLDVVFIQDDKIESQLAKYKFDLVWPDSEDTAETIAETAGSPPRKGLFHTVAVYLTNPDASAELEAQGIASQDAEGVWRLDKGTYDMAASQERVREMGTGDVDKWLANNAGQPVFLTTEQQYLFHTTPTKFVVMYDIETQEIAQPVYMLTTVGKQFADKLVSDQKLINLANKQGWRNSDNSHLQDTLIKNNITAPGL